MKKTALCAKCKKRTEHMHVHDTAHGIPETHMDGSERWVCVECGWFIKKEDATGENSHLEFVLD